MFGDRYQYALIALGVAVTLFFAYFFTRELFPEYKIYQEDYVALEKFRAAYTGEKVAPFKYGVKQIVTEREDRGPAKVERCISCHVALQISDFSPTKIARDINGEIVYDAKGLPQKVANENYVWKRLDEQIAALTKEGKGREAEDLRALKTASVGDFVYDVTKVLRMHPLMGRETRPFEYHPLEEYGCISCHNGNGQGLVTDRAHGPVFDGMYAIEDEGFKPEFLEKDPEHDPPFAHIFNNKPGHRLLFQTAPIYVGALIQAKCIQCHLTSDERLQSSKSALEGVYQARQKELDYAQKSYEYEKKNLATLKKLQESLTKEGYEATLAHLTAQSQDYSLEASALEALESQLAFLKKHPQKTLQVIAEQMTAAQSALKIKQEQLALDQSLLQHFVDVNTGDLPDTTTTGALQTEVDQLIKNYKRGQDLYLSQACYACHRIAGFARGGVGPELTREGYSYPWFVKESLVWPQADLKTSTMPNYRLDHEELQDLVTYLLGQKGERSALAGTPYKRMIAAWDAGKRMTWEEPVAADKIHDVDYGMTLFATEGCASCHRLEGFTSQVGYKEGDSNWFKKLFPEGIAGTDIVRTLKNQGRELDAKIAPNAKEAGLLETLEKTHPGLIISLYSPFKYAQRADSDPHYQARLHNVLMLFVQEYGLGRLIGPRPNWSGVYRSDEWLMEHFKNPQSHVPRSIMPVMPFDDTKFYTLTYMLDVLGRQNRDRLKHLWEQTGFRPDQAYALLCAQCHGDYLQGNGPVAEWIYPIPKNLKKGEFLRNLTRERVIEALKHGVQGTPMPPWGESWGESARDKPIESHGAVLSNEEIEQMTDWLFSQIPGGEVIRSSGDVPKWHYSAANVVDDLNQEGAQATSFKVETLFDKVANPSDAADPFSYYIKRAYYTPENIAAGQAFFDLNCATCHGKEGDGTGLRAAALTDAKPRMLTNLDWLHSRDDLRLLRSIKFGVPGTSMTPWGDLTNAKQRLDLVVFIRSLTEQPAQRAAFLADLYATYDTLDLSLSADKKWKGLREALKAEKEVYRDMGLQILTQNEAEKLLAPLEEILKLNRHKISLKNEKVVWTMTPEDEAKIESLGKEMGREIDRRLAQPGITPAQKLTLDHLKHKLFAGLQEAKSKRGEEEKIIHSVDSA